MALNKAAREGVQFWKVGKIHQVSPLSSELVSMQGRNLETYSLVVANP